MSPRKTVFIKDGFLTVCAIVFFCFLFLIAHATTPGTHDEVPPLTQINNTAALHTNLSAPSLPQDTYTNEVQPSNLSQFQESTEQIVPTEELVAPKAETPKPVEVKKEEIKTTPKVAAKPVAVPSTSADTVFAQQLIANIEAQTNAFRESQNLKPFRYEPTLGVNATQYSKTMLADDYLSHTSKAGCGLTCRFEANNYKAQAWGENLATMTFTDRPSAREVATFFMDRWKKSAGHRENLVSEDFTHQGIGVAQSNNVIYVTVQFANPL